MQKNMPTKYSVRRSYIDDPIFSKVAHEVSEAGVLGAVCLNPTSSKLGVQKIQSRDHLWRLAFGRIHCGRIVHNVHAAPGIFFGLFHDLGR